MTTDINHPASDLTSVLSNAKSKTSKKVSLKANMHKQEGHILRYLSSRKSTLPGNQLVDRGANGGLAGSDMRILSKTGCRISIMGIDSHQLAGIPIFTCAAKFETNDGPIIGIFNEYAFYGKGQSIHAPGQFEHFGHAVDERSVKVDGKQCITTLDGRALSLHIKERLAYIHSLGIPSDDDMETLPQIIFTSPDTWDPGVLDHSHSDPSHDPASTSWQQVNTDGSMVNYPYDNYGEYKDRVVCNLNLLLDLPYDHGPDNTSFFSVYADANGNDPITLHASVHCRYQEAYDWEKFCPFFDRQSEDVIVDTFQHTTHNGSFCRITGYKKPSQQSMLYPIGRMGRPTLLTSLASIGNLQPSDPYSSHCYSGVEKYENSTNPTMTRLNQQVVGSSRILTVIHWLDPASHRLAESRGFEAPSMPPISVLCSLAGAISTYIPSHFMKSENRMTTCSRTFNFGHGMLAMRALSTTARKLTMALHVRAQYSQARATTIRVRISTT